MNILDAKYFKMSNSIFYYGLTPIQRSVYSYLVCCAGQKGKCWPGMQNIAERCGCSPNAARAAVNELVRRKFIRKVATYRERPDGRRRQTNNTYYILELPDVPPQAQEEYREYPGDGGEVNHQDEEQQTKTSA